jgi:hypothetical protein
MPYVNFFNGEENVLPESYLQKLLVGDPLNNDAQNPLIFDRSKATL